MTEKLPLHGTFNHGPQNSRIHENHESHRGGYIHSICLDQSCRGRGVGRATIRNLLTRYSTLQLDVNIRKSDSHAFYTAVGFKTMSSHEAKI